tara:strand:+ start:6893 stop:7702 length:810 start_codon:yes stop_codon:yes gene_type:complete
MLEAVARKDRLFVTLGLLTVTAIFWAYLLAGAGMNMNATMPMNDIKTMPMNDIKMPMPVASWTLGYVVLMVVMWWVMMAAMMLPSAAPMILLFAAVNRSSAHHSGPVVPTSVFVAGYLVIWGGFSLTATFAQWGLTSAGLLDAKMRGNAVWVSGFLLIAAGLYQVTPMKNACLRHCQSPVQFVMRNWRSGPIGAMQMGLTHGAFCLGCCGAMMLLLFVGGVMNLMWIGGLAIFVLIEKLAGRWPHFSKLSGVALIVWGGILLARESGLG